MKPIIKWAGGKTQLLPEIKQRLPEEYNRYIEPFLGGGAVLFNLEPKVALVNDINSELINVYSQVKFDVDGLVDTVDKLDSVYSDKEYYYKNRERYNQKIIDREYDLEMASLFIWLNKHCFNGLYRVNKKGLFNVPFNHKHIQSSIDEDNIRLISEYLNRPGVAVYNEDFEVFLDKAQEGDFVFVDSPYIPESKTSSFVDYSKTGFGEEDHKRLRDKLTELDERGVMWMATNNNVPTVHELYSGYKIESVDARRNINLKGDRRTGKEVVIRNY